MRNILLVVLASVSCNVLPPTEDNFGDRFANGYCKSWKKCYRGYFEDEFSDLADCKDDVADDYEDLEDYYDDANCDFEDDEAQSCLNDMTWGSCEDWYDGDMFEDCAEVWDC